MGKKGLTWGQTPGVSPCNLLLFNGLNIVFWGSDPGSDPVSDPF